MLPVLFRAKTRLTHYPILIRIIRTLVLLVVLVILSAVVPGVPEIVHTRRFLGMTKMPLLPVGKLPEVSSIGQVS